MKMYVVKDSKCGKYIDCDSDGELTANDLPYSLYGNAEYALGFIDGYQDHESRDYYKTEDISVDDLIVVPVEIREVE